MAITYGTPTGGELVSPGASGGTISMGGLALSAGSNAALIVGIFPNNSTNFPDQVTGASWGVLPMTEKIQFQRSTTAGNFFTDGHMFVLTGYSAGTQDLSFTFANALARTGIWFAIEAYGVSTSTLLTDDEDAAEFINQGAPSLSMTLTGSGDLFCVMENQQAIDPTTGVTAPSTLLGKIDGTTAAPTAEQGLVIAKRSETSAGTYSIAFSTLSSEEPLLIGFALNEVVAEAPSVTAATLQSYVPNSRTAGATAIGVSSVTISGTFTGVIFKTVADGAGTPTQPTAGDAGWLGSVPASTSTTLRGSVDTYVWARNGSMIGDPFGPLSTDIDFVAIYRIYDVTQTDVLLATIDIDTEGGGFNPAAPQKAISGLDSSTSYLIEIEAETSMGETGPRSLPLTVVLEDDIPPVTAGPPISVQAGDFIGIAISAGEDPSGIASIFIAYRSPAGSGSWIVAEAAYPPTPSDPEDPQSNTVYMFDASALSPGDTFEAQYALTDGAGNVSDLETQEAEITLLDIPQNVAVTRVDGDTVSIDHDTVTGADGYRYTAYDETAAFIDFVDVVGGAIPYEWDIGQGYSGDITVAALMGLSASSESDPDDFSTVSTTGSATGVAGTGSSISVWEWPDLTVDTTEDADSVTFTVYTTVDGWTTTIRQYVDGSFLQTHAVIDLGGGEFGAEVVVTRSSGGDAKQVRFSALEVSTGDESPLTTTINVEPGSIGDPLAPDSPALILTVGSTSATVSWAAVTTPVPAVAYDVYVNGVFVIQTTSTSYVVTRGTAAINVNVASVGEETTSTQSGTVTVPLISTPVLTLREPRDGTTRKSVNIFG